MNSCPGLLSPQECNKGGLGWFVLISAIVPLTFPERWFFLVQLLLSILAICVLHLEYWEETWVCCPTKSVQIFPYMQHELRVYSVYPWLQLSLGVCTKWLLWDLNQRIVSLHSSSDVCMLFLPSLDGGGGGLRIELETLKGAKTELSASVNCWKAHLVSDVATRWTQFLILSIAVLK